MYYSIDLIILLVMIFSALMAVMTRSLIRSALALAAASVVLTIMMFRLDSWLAAVFELSVCAGLISVIFISTISLTEPLMQSEVIQHMKDRMKRFVYLPVILLAAGVVLWLQHANFTVSFPAAEIEKDVRKILWDERLLDVLGQVIVMLTGVFGVVVLFKERKK